MCIGTATLDAIALVEDSPRSDERAEAIGYVDAGGGPAATAAVTAARLGLRVAFVGVVGDDAAGRLIRSGLRSEGVDIRELRTVIRARSARSVVVVERKTTHRSIAHFPGTSRMDALSPRALRMCRSTRWLHVDTSGYEAVRQVNWGESRPRISLDAGNPVHQLDLSGVTLYAPTEASIRARYPGRTREAALRDAGAEGPQYVVVTAGGRGSWLAWAGGIVQAPAHPAPIVSTLGAGDVFHGALLVGLIRDLAPPAALGFANVVAAISCSGLDGRSAIPLASDTEALLSSAAALSSRPRTKGDARHGNG